MSLETRLTDRRLRRDPRSDRRLEAHAWQTSRVGSSGLIGRGSELQLIREFLHRAGSHGDCLLFFGEPGIGKTVLLNAAAEAAEASGIRVLRAGGAQFEAELSFSGLHQLLLPLQQDFSRLSEGQRDALKVAVGFGDGEAPNQLVVANAVLSLLRLAAMVRPVLMVVDDLPWVDRVSARVLGVVVRRVGGPRVGFLAASGTGEESFFNTAGLPGHEIAPLDSSEASELMRTRFPALAPTVRDRLLSEAEGNPLAVLELPAALSDPQRAALEALPAVLPITRRLHSLFAAKVEEMPRRTRTLLLLMALTGRGDLRTLDTAGSRSAGVDDLVPAERARLAYLDDATRRLTFRHPMIRAVVVDMSTVSERRSAHATLADLSADQPDRRAWHLGEAAMDADETVACLLEQSAHMILRRGDAVGAVAALIRAAELSPDRVEHARRLAEAAYVGADVAGGLRNISQLLGEIRDFDPDLSSSLQAAVAAAFLLLDGDGNVEAAHRLLVGAVEQAGQGEGIDQAALHEALFTLVRVCFFGGRAELWEPVHRAVERLGPKLPLATELCAATTSDPLRTPTDELDRLDNAIEDLAVESDPTRIVRVAMAGIFVDRMAGCRDPMLRVIGNARAGGAITSGIRALIFLSVDEFWSGQWDQAKQHADEALGLCNENGYPLYAALARQTLAIIAAARGDYDTSQTLTDNMLQWATPRQLTSIQCQAWAVRALAALGRGDFEEAYQQASRVSPTGVLSSHNPYVLWNSLDLVESAVRSGRQAKAALHARAVEQSGMAMLSPRLALVSKAVMAIATPNDGALALFEAALATPGTDRWQYDMARVQLAYGERLRRARSLAESRWQLRSALETFQRLGACPWAARTAQELRATGQTKPRADQRHRYALTPQELEIAALAAKGLSNKQIAERLFMSHRTVGAHLYRIFPKLEITSRAALRDALAEISQDIPQSEAVPLSRVG
jgi:DNA-binding CsgD family transcriptional regulator